MIIAPCLKNQRGLGLLPLLRGFAPGLRGSGLVSGALRGLRRRGARAALGHPALDIALLATGDGQSTGGGVRLDGRGGPGGGAIAGGDRRDGERVRGGEERGGE